MENNTNKYNDFGFKPPVGEINGFPYRPGYRRYNGASIVKEGINFTIASSNATSCELLLYKNGEQEPYAVLPFPEDTKMGGVFSMIVYGLIAGEFEYAYRMDGPNNPEKGLIFNKETVLLDPYAEVVTGQSKWGNEPFANRPYHGSISRNVFSWTGSKNPVTPPEDTIIYELHVRGFTQNPNSGVKFPGTFAGLQEKIPYLKELGITAVELMPIFEFDETSDIREHEGKLLPNYWGYNTVSFFSPNAAYAATDKPTEEGTELKQLIKTFHDNGIEVFLDVVFNHTAEGNEDGPVFSFKGIDNNVFYMLTPDGGYYNFSGCGNTFNCNNAQVRAFIMECLRHWVSVYHIDGFRFDLASILGRNQDGEPLERPPLIESIATDRLLKDVKLIAEAWDAGGMYQVGSFPSYNKWAQWNGKFRDDLRSFLKGDLWAAPGAAHRLTGSADLFSGYPTKSNTSINFLTCHDGFTLYDLYAYNEKHNEDNGWNNTDGTDDNRSWNCGVEGPTDDKAINDLRFKMIKNAMTALMLSRGIPMFYSGDEFGATNSGNNNTYCQDNEVSWTDWSYLEKNRELFDYTKALIQFRKDHKVISRDLTPIEGLPAISVHTEVPYGVVTGETKSLSVMYAGKEGDKEDIVLFGLNPYWEPTEVYLPPLPEGLEWKKVMGTTGSEVDSEKIVYDPRSSAVFIATSGKE